MIQPAPVCQTGIMTQVEPVHRMVRLLQLVTLAILLLMISSCRKDDEGIQPPPAMQESEDDPCREAPVLGLPPNVYSDTSSVYFALASPNNPDEILLHYKQTIIIANLHQGTAKVILESVASFLMPSWGSNDWILFRTNQGLMKVKSNGDSLTFITGLEGLHPTWHPGGYKYLHTELSGGATRSIVRDRHDQILDTLPTGMNMSLAWVSDNMLWYSRGYYLIDADSLVNLSGFGGAQVAAVDEDLTYSNSFLDGLFTMRRSTGEVSQILDPYVACDRIAAVSYSPLRNQLLGLRLLKTLLPDGRSEIVSRHIVWLNMDGSIHEVIDHRPFLENL